MEAKQIIFNKANLSTVNNSMSISCSILFINFFITSINNIIAHATHSIINCIKYMKVNVNNCQINFVRNRRANVKLNNINNNNHCASMRKCNVYLHEKWYTFAHAFAASESSTTPHSIFHMTTSNNNWKANSVCAKRCNDGSGSGNGTECNTNRENSLKFGDSKKCVTFFKIICILMLISEATALPPVIRIGEYP